VEKNVTKRGSSRLAGQSRVAANASQDDCKLEAEASSEQGSGRRKPRSPKAKQGSRRAEAGVSARPSIVSNGSPTVNSFVSPVQAPATGELQLTVDGTAVLDRFASVGWVTIPPVLPSVGQCQRTYSFLDEVLDGLSDPAVAAALDAVTRRWLADEDRRRRWWHIPPGFRDRVEEAGRPDKSYVQTVPGFSRLLRLSPEGEYLATRLPALSKLLFHLDAIAAEATEIFIDIANALDQHVAIKRATMIDVKPTVVVKAIRYEPGTAWGTEPHRDKSALSMICWSDEPTSHLAVAPTRAQPTAPADFQPVDAPPESVAGTGATLLVGGTLELAGVPMKPSYHAVLPVESRRPRHALIAFLLVPYLDADTMETTLPIPFTLAS